MNDFYEVWSQHDTDNPARGLSLVLSATAEESAVIYYDTENFPYHVDVRVVHVQYVDGVRTVTPVPAP